ncbi:DUF3667 domain-containing protein [Duganella sp. Root1480D1]|uniref:DUF3667 domain-containing protein n=1 Tax=Duganella sp. Root1480D1 TaxID=1736471 RepID=UPI000B26A56B|nr:DUF3667 domain-containing protein [Duganella sp. Root1480D1]
MKNLFFHFGRDADTHRPPEGETCHNCHAAVSTPYCGECGQKATVHIASAHEFIHHFIGHYVAAEGKLWRTLGWLFAKPGQLTVEFIRGRRGQFIDPLRLLLTISLLMFLVMKWQVHHLPTVAMDAQTAQGQAMAAPATLAQAQHKVDRSLFAVLSSASPQFALNYGKFLALPEQARDAQLWETWLRAGPTIMLCLIPLMAVVLKLLHLGTGWRYGEHLVFSMHLQTVSLVAALLIVGGMRDTTKLAMFAAMAVYILLAMRKVYGGGWIVLLLRTAILGFWLTLSFEWLTRTTFLLRFT